MKNGKHIDNFGTQRWFVDGELHREDGSAVLYKDGGERWYKHGRLHRDNGPAIKEKLYEKWYENDRLHRLDGPAIIWYEQPELSKWFIRGEPLSKEEFWSRLSAEQKLKILFNTESL